MLTRLRMKYGLHWKTHLPTFPILRPVLVAAMLVLSVACVGYVTRAAVLVEQAQQQVVKARADRQDVLDVLNGKKVMVQHFGKYAEVATVKWQVVEEVK